MSLPGASVVREGDNAYAWRVNGEKLQKVALTLGDRDARTGAFALRGGLAEGDKVLAIPERHAEGRPAGAGRRARRSPPWSSRSKRREKSAMFLSDFSIKQPVTTVAIVIVLMCLGLLALKKLRVNQIPDVEKPVMSVNIPYPGASPETVEREIINRVEKPLQSIPQVYEIWSTASESNASFIIIFDFKKDMSRPATRSATRSLGALQAADRDARAGAVAARSGGGADHASWAVVDQADRMPRSRA